MKKTKMAVLLGVLALIAPTSWAASFDCAKAKSPLEKLICSNPELDAVDARMGEVYKTVSKSFPLQGFIPLNQRMFLSAYSTCMSNNAGKPESSPAAVKRCVGVVQQRIAELETFGTAKVYADLNGKYTQDSLAILTYTVQGKSMIRLWGNWMPDAYNPKPFPNGMICDIDGQLTPVKGGFVTSNTDDAVFRITDASVKITGFISCTARNGIADGEYKRIK